MNKKDVLKLKPGTWLEILWADSPSSVAMLLEKPRNERGDVSLHCFYPESQTVDSHAVHSQIVRVLGNVAIPEPQCSRELRLIK